MTITTTTAWVRRTRGGAVTEKTCDEWGMSGVRLTFTVLGVDRITWTQPVKRFTDTPDFVAGDTVDYYVNQTRRFTGTILETNASASPNRESMSFEAVGPGNEFERTTYYQDWTSFNPGGVPYGSTLAVLFYNTTTIYTHPVPMPPGYTDPPGYPNLPGTTLITAGQQIWDALNWMITDLGCPFQLGQTRDQMEPVGLYLPAVQKFDIKVWEVIRIALEKAPDVVSYWDYSTSPPTIWFKRRSQLGAVKLTLGTDIEGADPTARASLVVPAVHFIYVRTSTTNGMVSGIETVHDYWPAAAWESAKNRLKASYLRAGAMVQTIMLEGSATTTVSGTFEGYVLDVTDKNWWEYIFPALEKSNSWDGYVTPWSGSIGTFKTGWDALDLDAPDGNGGYPSIRNVMAASPGTPLYVVTSGDVPKWLTTHTTRRVRFRLAAHFYNIDPVTGITEKDAVKVMDKDLVVTTCPPGTYSTRSTVTQAEPIPSGLAQSIYDALSQTYYEGSVTIKEKVPTGQVRPGNVVNLVGQGENPSSARYGSIRAIVQQVVEDVDHGQTTVGFGLPRWLGAAEIIDFMRISRNRIQWTNPRLMGDGTVGGSSTVDFPLDGAMADGMDEHEAVSEQVFNGTYDNGSKSSAEGAKANEQLGLVQIKGRGGIIKAGRVAGTPSTRIELSGNTSTQTFHVATDTKVVIDGNVIPAGKTARFREAYFCEATGIPANPWRQVRCLVLMTEGLD
jgi:hypothetical protein